MDKPHSQEDELARPTDSGLVLQFSTARIFLAEEEEEEEEEEEARVVVSLSDITEKKRAELALKESEERFRLLAESSLTGIYLIQDQKFAYVNQSLAATFGYTTEEIIGKLGPLDLTHPDDRPRVVENIRRRVAGEVEAVRYDFRGVKKDGTIIYLEVHGRRIEYAGKVGIIGTLVDITERKRAESLRLRLSQVLESIASDEALPQILERLVRAIEEFVPDMKGSVLLLDADGKRLRHGSAPSLPEDYNTAIDGLLIGPRVGSCGTAAYEKRLVIVEDIQTDPLWADFRDLAARHGLRACWSQPIIDHEGAVLGTLALYYQQPRKPTEAELDLINTAANIAGIAIKRKRAEEALRTSEAKYRSLFENVLEGIYQSTPDGRLLTANPALVRMLGYESEEGLKGVDIGRDLYVKPEDRETFTQQLEKKGIVQNLELTLKRKDGTHIALLENAHVVRNEQGAVLYYEGTLTDIAERKRAEEALRESEEKFRSLAEYSPNMIFINKGGRVVYANKMCEAMMGYSREEFYSPEFDFMSLIAPESRQAVMESYKRHLNGEEIPPYEYTLITREGKRLIGIHNTKLINYAGSTAILGIVTDITERKRAEERLAAERNLLRTLIDNLPDYIFIKDVKSRFVLTNTAVAHLLAKKSPEELIGKTDFDLFPQEFAARYYADERKILRSGRSLIGREEPIVDRWGNTRWVLTTKVPLRDSEGKIIGLVGMNRDITERKRVEETMRLQSAALESAANAVMITDRSGKITWVNEAFTRLTGYTRSEVVGENPRILKSGEQDPSFYKNLWETILSGAVWRGELANRRKDGRLYTEEMTITPVLGERGEVSHFIAIKEDITERKKLELQLVQAQKMESVGTLAGGIAHDFNNILGVILGHASMLKGATVEADNLTKKVEAILKAAERGAGLVRQLLTFARRAEVQVESVRVNDMLEELVGLLEETFPETITFSLQLGKDIPSINADPNQLHQALLNLAINARDAMLVPRGDRRIGGELTIRTEVVAGSDARQKFFEARANEYVCISISDTGIGMDENVKAHLFEPFFTMKEKGKGTGLGLAVVYGIVKSHQGFIEVESEVGCGTTFRLYFPIPLSTIEGLKVPAAELRDAPGGDETILVVEDEEMLLDLLKSLLETKGYRVLTAANGLQAVGEYLKQKDEIALVFMDVGLPKLDGWEVLQRLKSINPRVKVVLASGYIKPHVKSEMLKAGAKHFVQKPYVPTEILRHVREVLDRSEPSSAPQGSG